MLRNSGSLFAESSVSCATSRRSCFCSIVSSFGTNFADTLRMAKSSVKMECTEPVPIPTSYASSQTVTWRSCMPKSALGQWVRHFGLLRAYRNERRSPPTCGHMNRLYHSLICVMPMASSPKTRWIFRMVSTWLPPSFWQNLMQYRCSSRSVIFAENNNATRAAYTTLHLPTTAHLPCFISFRGKKITSDTFWTDHVQLHFPWLKFVRQIFLCGMEGILQSKLF